MADSKRTLIRFEFSETSSADLRGKQSVRTTFKISEDAINALSLLATQMGIKQKSLFDHLMEDTEVLRHIASQAKELDNPSRRLAKTYVISRKTLDTLERISLKYGAPRDALVEHSIGRILPLLSREKAKHEKRKEVAGDIQHYLEMGLSLMAKVEENIGEDDPVFQEVISMIRGVKHCSESIDAMVERGRKIEEY
ncbi:hypothetical protein [Desulforhopalus sp. IMCC35007]|uniref:hypothetical protein n=1 Tax=Desulforhopalus sp. IMCC35007 TaxID=2569543 RepID=UPI0010AEB813|nr:hypothetical protein [Desulforhopalus sp. IMCC35007]TKB06512.1 hypothetical protein FCL48_20490 [Desulforhopalus sp. IMCC35007]